MSNTNPQVGDKLTPREIQVLEGVIDGLSNKLIADRLGISDHTAKFHVFNLQRKLGVDTRTAAAVQGLRRGLVPLNPPEATA